MPSWKLYPRDEHHPLQRLPVSNHPCAIANVFVRELIEGEKKYSPPFGTTHCAVRLRFVAWLPGLVPDITRAVGSTGTPFSGPICPMIGSQPGVMGALKGGNAELFAQAKQ